MAFYEAVMVGYYSLLFSNYSGCQVHGSQLTVDQNIKARGSVVRTQELRSISNMLQSLQNSLKKP